MVYFSKKDLYHRLCDDSVLIDGGRMSFGLEKLSGAKCFMISAKSLSIVGGNDPRYWDWVTNDDSRFTEDAELLESSVLQIQGKIDSQILTPHITYATYLIFKLHRDTWGLGKPLQKTNVILAGKMVSENSVCLNPDEGQIDRYMLLPEELPETTECAIVPKEREDGWMEIELGEFYIQEGVDGEVWTSLIEVRGGHYKNGLIVQGIEVKPKASNSKTMPFTTVHDNSSAEAPGYASSASFNTYEAFNTLENTEVLYCPFLDRPNGAMMFHGVNYMSGYISFMIPARALSIIWGNDRRYWKWSSRPDSRLFECAELIDVCWLEILGKLDTKFLCRSIAYKVFFIFKLTNKSYGFRDPLQEININFGGTTLSQHSVCLSPGNSWQLEMNVTVPRDRSDGWMEVDIGDLSSSLVVGEVQMSLKETNSNGWKSGLIVQGIEVRPTHWRW